MTNFASHWWLQKTSVHLILLPPIETNNGANTFTQNLNISQVGPGVASSNQILLDHALSRIGSQFNKLPTHQQIAVLGQVVGMAEGDPATSKAVLEPAEKTDGRGCPVGAKNKRKKTQARQEKSTRHDPSGFEYEITRSTRTKRKCTNCRKPGHYKKRCPDLRNQSTEDQ